MAPTEAAVVYDLCFSRFYLNLAIRCRDEARVERMRSEDQSLRRTQLLKVRAKRRSRPRRVQRNARLCGSSA